MRRVFVVLLSLTAAVPGLGAGQEAMQCTVSRDAVVAVRDAVRVAGASCDFVVSCATGTPGGCPMTITVTVTGTGLAEARVEGPFGFLWCGPTIGGCSIQAPVQLPAGTTDVADCSATGVAGTVTLGCAANPTA